MAGSGAPAPLPALGLLLAAAAAAQGGDPAPLPSLGLLLAAAEISTAQGGDPAPLPHIGLLLGPAATRRGRVVGRGRVRSRPKPALEVAAPVQRMSLLGGANDLAVTNERETITLARVAERRLKAAAQKQNIEALEKVLMEWF